ncbi:MAG: hypothetical protein CM1200mP30_07260 [Pseudomonadota bacterium]|nr:MAG: hypothetical protein CM1200mP30_07260 [Pseudomonadota bacterium]
MPFTVFLNPDGSFYYKYAGALYADEFLEVIQDVHKNISENRSVDGEENSQIEYAPPSELKTANLVKIREMFHQGILDNFDLKEYGLGTGEKSILHQSFIYLSRFFERTRQGKMPFDGSPGLLKKQLSIFTTRWKGIF